MVVEIQAPVEALPTHVTFVWFFSRVDPLVSLKIRTLAEALATHVALKRFLSCVNPLVALETGG